MPAQHVEVETLVNCSLEDAFATVNDLQRFNEWNPFFKLDPNTDWHLEGPRVGPGAIYVWSSKKTGRGQMRIDSVTAPIRINTVMTFYMPKEAHAEAYFRFEPAGGQTRIVWGMQAERSIGATIIAKLIGLDRMMAKSFTGGLADLKAILEAK